MLEGHKLRPDQPLYDILKWMSTDRIFAWLPLAVVCIYAATLNGYWRYQPDSALYLALGRSLARSGSFTWNFHPHVYVWPGFPALLSVVYAAVGENFLVLNVLMALLGVGCVLAGRSLYACLCESNVRAGICIMILGFSGTLLYYSRYILSDVPFTLLVMLGLYCGLRLTECENGKSWRWTAAAAVIACAAVFVRPHGPALLIALVVGVWLRRGAFRRWRSGVAETAALCLPALLAAGGWLYRCALVKVPRAPTYHGVFLPRLHPSSFLVRLLRKAPELLDGVGNVLAGVDVDELGGLCMSLVIILGVARSVRRRQFIPVSFGVIYLGAVLLGNPGRRYLLPVLPLLVFWLVEGVFTIGHWLLNRHERLSPTLIRVIGLFALGFLLSWNLGRIIDVVWETRRPDFYQSYEKGLVADHMALSEWLCARPAARRRVLVRDHRLLHYLAEVEAWQEPVRLHRVPPGQALRIVRAAFDYVVLTEGQETREPVAIELVRTHPEAFEEVAQFGELTVYRVRPASGESPTTDP